MIKLINNKEKIQEYNNLVKETKKEYPDLCYDEIENVEDFFIPYEDFDPEVNLYTPDTSNDFTGVYIGWTMDDFLLELGSYERLPIEECLDWKDFGIADNASQVIEYFNRLKDDFSLDDNYIIFMMPVYKEEQPEDGGWRWHKWGQYIGNYNIRHEYLYDEDIEMVYTFNIIKVKKI